jgi:hypothetical protein
MRLLRWRARSAREQHALHGVPEVLPNGGRRGGDAVSVGDEANRLMIQGLVDRLPMSDSPSYQCDLRKWLAAARGILNLIECFECNGSASPAASLGSAEAPHDGQVDQPVSECSARKALQHLTAELMAWANLARQPNLLEAATEALDVLSLPCPCQQVRADLEEALQALKPFAEDALFEECDPDDQQRAARVLEKHRKP